MASLLYPAYEGIIPDTLIVVLQSALNINTGTLRIGYARSAIPDDRYTDLFGEALREHEDNEQVEARAVELLLEWKELKGDEYERTEVNGTTTVVTRGSVKERKKELADELSRIYPIDNRKTKEQVF